MTITKSISIVNDGVGMAGMTATAGVTGITISAGASDVINLRGLTIEGAGLGQTGIQFNSGASLTIENCVIRHVTNIGINFGPSATSNLLVSNTLVADNGAAGISVHPSGSSVVTAVFNRVEVNNNVGSGIAVTGQNSPGRSTPPRPIASPPAMAARAFSPFRPQAKRRPRSRCSIPSPPTMIPALRCRVWARPFAPHSQW